MKVLFCSKTSPIGGGVERWLAQLLPGLQQRGHEIVLALARGHCFHNPEKYLATYPELSTTPIRILDGTSGVAEGRRRAVESLLQREQPDIVVPVQLHEVLGAVSARRMAGQTIRIAYPVHEDGIWIFRAIEEYADRIDAVISVNRLILDALGHFLQWPSDRLFHVRCGAAPPIKTKASDNRGALRLGFCGKLEEEQKRVSDLATLCETLELLKVDYELRIAGTGDAARFLSERLKRQIAEGRVTLLGWMSPEQLEEAFYPQIDALIITSSWETGPLVAWEAMMHGVLVVTSQYRGLREEEVLGQRENALIFPVGHPEQAALMLKELSHDRERFAAIAENGRQFAQRSLGVDQMIDGWASVLSTVLLRPPRPVGTRPPYNRSATASGWLEHWMRNILQRPYHHADAHAEWPRTQPGHVSPEDQSHWIDELTRFTALRQSVPEGAVENADFAKAKCP
jgi:glycosyltransferase involved in cell wall biosynthesis